MIARLACGEHSYTNGTHETNLLEWNNRCSFVVIRDIRAIRVPPLKLDQKDPVHE